MPDQDEWEDVPQKKAGAATATADSEWEDVPAATPVAKQAVPAQKQMTPAKPGFWTRLRESVGLPSREEAEAMTPKTFTEAVKTGAKEGLVNMPLAPVMGAYDYGKRLIGNIGDTIHEQKEALQNISEGGPLLPNISKGVEGILKTGVQAVPFIGEPTYTAGEDISKGNYAGAAGGLTGVIGQVAAPEIAERAPRAMKVAVKKVGEPLHIGMSGEELLKKGVSPRAQATGWDEAIARPGVQRVIVEHNQATPIKSAAELDEAIPLMKEKIWNDKVQPALDRQGKRPVDMKPAADAVRSQVTDEVKEFEPEKADELNSLADKLEKSRDVEGTNRLLKYVNGKLESYFSKYPSARRANLANNPDVAGWEAARRAIRNQFMDTLEQAGEAQIGDARKDYGALETIGKEVERRVNVADRSKPFSLARILGWTSLPTVAGPILGEVVHHFNKPDVMIRHGINRLNPVAETPFTPPAKFTPSAPPPPAAVQQTLGLPRPEHGPLFNIEQTPRLRGEVEEPRIGTISGQQQPLNIPPSPEQAPLFSIPQTARPVPEQPSFPKFEKATGPVFRGTAENVKPASEFAAATEAPKATVQEPLKVKLPNPEPVKLNVGESTADRFYDKAKDEWSPEREANHSAIAEAATAGKVPPKGRPPQATITLGGTGAGKTTVTRGILGDNPNLVNVDSDANKLLVPEYEGLKTSDPQKAAARVHDESKAISKRIIQEAVGKGLDFVYDTSTGGGGEGLFKRLKDLGYDVKLVFADVPTEEAVKRAELRARQSTDPTNKGRIVPEAVIRNKHSEAAKSFLKYQNSPYVDEIRAFDTTSRTPQEFYSRTKAGEKVADQKIMDRIREKAGANAEVK